MALPKKQFREKLQEWGIAEEHMETAVKYILDGNSASLDGNSASLDALREQMDAYKTEAEKVPGLEKQLDELKKTSGDAAKVQEAFDAYKLEQENKARSLVRSALVNSVPLSVWIIQIGRGAFSSSSRRNCIAL